MIKPIWMSAVAIGVFAVCTIVLPMPGQRVVAQAAGSYVNAVDLDIVPAERDNYLAAITENGMAAAKEPGCRRFDILNLASDHFKKYAATTAKMVAKRESRPMSVTASNSVAK